METLQGLINHSIKEQPLELKNFIPIFKATWELGRDILFSDCGSTYRLILEQINPESKTVVIVIQQTGAKEKKIELCKAAGRQTRFPIPLSGNETLICHLEKISSHNQIEMKFTKIEKDING